MAVYKQGVYVEEEATALETPITGNSALQVIFGTAPVNMTKEPSQAVNVPILCNSFSECVENLGYSGDYESYTLCQSMDANFKQFAVAPVVFVNVLDPEKHKKTNDEVTIRKTALLYSKNSVIKETIYQRLQRLFET